MKRFSPTTMDQHFKATMKEDPQGDYVLHSDFEKLVEALKIVSLNACCKCASSEEVKSTVRQTLKELGIEHE